MLLVRLLPNLEQGPGHLGHPVLVLYCSLRWGQDKRRPKGLGVSNPDQAASQGPCLGAGEGQQALLRLAEDTV